MNIPVLEARFERGASGNRVQQNSQGGFQPMALTKRLSVLLLAFACGAACSCWPQRALAANQSNPISVFAGTGRAGIADGPAGSAEFILPSALAIDSHNDLYVTDAAAQRVRMIRFNGSVTTLAGSGPLTSGGLWVAPGFQDGPALQAQFNQPSGIAVGADGRIYIADTNNHCIRLLSGGIVSTYAGTCGALGTKDGPRAEAMFSYPRQLCFDANGNLYVADFENAVRKVDSQGMVSTLTLHTDKRVTGVQANGEVIYVADTQGILIYDARTGDAKRIPAYYNSRAFPPPTAGEVELGSPYALAVSAGAQGVFYTDLRSDSVRRFSPAAPGGLVTYLSGVPREDAVVGNGWMTAPIHGPMGIALDAHGRLFVADSGHKRIVQITGFGRDSGFVVDPVALMTIPARPSEYRILISGNSFTYYLADSSNSIGALVEQHLIKDGVLQASGKTPRVITLALTQPIAGQASLAKQVISRTKFDFVLIFCVPTDVAVFAPAGPVLADRKHNPVAQKLYRQEQVDTVASLNAASIKSMFVLVPDNGIPFDSLYLHENLDNIVPDALPITPVESQLVNEYLLKRGLQLDSMKSERLMLDELRGIGPPILDLFPVMQTYETAPLNKPLFANADIHPSPFGRAFIAEQIVKRLEQLQPWHSMRK